MRILILGGTLFLGRHLVVAAQRAGHQLTLFNRGRSNPDLFPEVEQIRGERERQDSLEQLRQGHWDWVVDTCGYLPRVVGASARALRQAAGAYLFISSLSAVEDEEGGGRPGLDESAPVVRLPDPTTEVVDGHTYGGLKALCEEAAEAELPGRVLVVRPGLIVGEHDPSDRFTYWPWRVARGGEVLAPGEPRAPVQFIDAADLAEFLLRLMEADARGLLHATGPLEPLTMEAFLDACRATLGRPGTDGRALAPAAADASWQWLEDAFLLQQGVAPYTDMPLWIAGDPGFNAFDLSRARAAGLRIRPLEETIAATYSWQQAQAAGAAGATDGAGATDTAGPGAEIAALRTGLTLQREQEILQAWRQRK
jgi:2'-hydroxyisoflavone reductase